VLCNQGTRGGRILILNRVHQPEICGGEARDRKQRYEKPAAT
jgi:hypothetical protein